MEFIQYITKKKNMLVGLDQYKVLIVNCKNKIGGS